MQNKMFLNKRKKKKETTWDLLDGLVAKILSPRCRGPGFNP